MARKQYRAWTPDDSFLFPPSPRDRLPKDHLVYFVLELVEVLDLSEIEASIHAIMWRWTGRRSRANRASTRP